MYVHDLYSHFARFVSPCNPKIQTKSCWQKNVWVLKFSPVSHQTTIGRSDKNAMAQQDWPVLASQRSLFEANKDKEIL